MTEQVSPPKSNFLRKQLLFLLKIALAFVAFFIIYKKINAQKVAEYLLSSNLPWLLLAFVIFFFSKAVSAVRLNLYFKQHNVRISEKQNLLLYLMGMFYNLYVPLVGGEAYKIYWIKLRQNIRVKSLVWASLHDRISGLVTLSFFAVLFFLSSSLQWPYKLYSLILLPLGYAAYFGVIKIFFKEYLPVFNRSNVLSLIVQATQILCSFCVLMSLGVNDNQLDYLFIFLLSCYAYMIPVIGAREMAFVFGADAMHLDVNRSLAISLFFYLSLATTSLTGMFLLFFPQYLERD
jgi:glycosyltransferase 2 family protein